MPTVLVASGGTGGHLFPALALGHELVRRHPSTRIVFVGPQRTATKDAVGDAGFEWRTVPGRGMPRRRGLSLVPFVWDLVRGMLAACSLVRRLEPDIAIGFGNYASFTPLYAAHRRGVPVVIHEGNALPGKANRLLARYARAVAVQFAEAGEALRTTPGPGATVVSLPVRSELLELPDAREARRSYGLDEDAFTLLVMGGSQGAKRLNEITCAALPGLAQLGIQVIHLCGAAHEADVRNAYESSSLNHAVCAFEPQMTRAYAAVDAAICRAGAATLAELAVTATPALLVPYPFATEGHQAKNAEVFKRIGAAYSVEETHLQPGVLIEHVRRMMHGSVRLEIGHSIRRLACPDAAQRLADLVEMHMT